MKIARIDGDLLELKALWMVWLGSSQNSLVRPWSNQLQPPHSEGLKTGRRIINATSVALSLAGAIGEVSQTYPGGKDILFVDTRCERAELRATGQFFAARAIASIIRKSGA